MEKITKAVIPCGGLGTRFLPITKAVPKEILPVIDTPVLAHIVDEAIESGITDILIVLGQGKEAIREYFSPSPALEETLRKAGKLDFLATVQRTYGRANITFVRQEKPLGSGDAVRLAKPFTGPDPFMLAWGDDLIYAQTPVMAQLIGCFAQTGKSVLGVQTIEGDDIVKYGVARVGSHLGRAYECLSVVEKPPLDKIPSRLAALGRYVLTPAIYDEIAQLRPGKGGELQFTDALNALCATQGVYAYDFEGRRYDMGDKFGAVQACVEYGLRSDDMRDKLRAYLVGLCKTL